MAPIDIRFIPVISVLPAQHRAQVVVGEAADGAGKENFGIGDCGTKNGIICPITIADQASVVRNRERGEGIGVAAPGQAVRSGSPVFLVGALEGVLGQQRTRGGAWRGRSSSSG